MDYKALFTSQISSLIEEAKRKSKGDYLEIEARFGTFGKIFTPEIDYQASKALEKAYSVFDLVIQEENISIFKNFKIVNGKIIEKKQLAKKDLKEYSFRLSASSEKILDSYNKDEKLIREYKKTRKTFNINNVIKVDIDRIDSKYSVEIEIIDIQCPNIVEIFYENILSILRIINRTSVLLPLSEKKCILEDFKKVFKVNKPVNLVKDLKEKYVASVKLDGEQIYIFVYKSKVYMIDRRIEKVINYDISVLDKKYEDVVFECELFQEKFYVYDACIELLTEERLLFVKNFVKDLGNEKVKYKDYSIDFEEWKKDFNPYSLSLKFITSYKIKERANIYDGVILLEKDKVYSQCRVFKYKPKEMNTIDFKILKKSKEESSVALGVYGSPNKNIHFGDLNVENHEIFKRLKVGSVIEAKINEDLTYSFVRERPDKVKGNYVDVAKKILEEFKYPLNLYRQLSDIDYLERFCHFSKRYILESIGNFGNTLLFNLQGKDIQKVLDYCIKKLYILEESEEILEKYEKIKSNAITKNFDINLYDNSVYLDVVLNLDYIEKLSITYMKGLKLRSGSIVVFNTNKESLKNFKSKKLVVDKVVEHFEIYKHFSKYDCNFLEKEELDEEKIFVIFKFV